MHPGNITPASATVHVLAFCVQKCELASMHTNGQRVPLSAARTCYAFLRQARLIPKGGLLTAVSKSAQKLPIL